MPDCAVCGEPVDEIQKIETHEKADVFGEPLGQGYDVHKQGGLAFYHESDGSLSSRLLSALPF